MSFAPSPAYAVVSWAQELRGHLAQGTPDIGDPQLPLDRPARQVVVGKIISREAQAPGEGEPSCIDPLTDIDQNKHDKAIFCILRVITWNVQGKQRIG